MELYHYTTWMGENIEREGVITPSIRYAEFAPRTVLTEWPYLTFLSVSEHWEPSIQALSREGYYEKCGSSPEAYSELGIPCWKFQVQQEVLLTCDMYDMLPDKNWLRMLQDAIMLGGKISEWVTTAQDCIVVEAWKWEDGKWEK